MNRFTPTGKLTLYLVGMAAILWSPAWMPRELTWATAPVRWAGETPWMVSTIAIVTIAAGLAALPDLTG